MTVASEIQVKRGEGEWSYYNVNIQPQQRESTLRITKIFRKNMGF